MQLLLNNTMHLCLNHSKDQLGIYVALVDLAMECTLVSAMFN